MESSRCSRFVLEVRRQMGRALSWSGAAVLGFCALIAPVAGQTFVNWENPPLHAVDLSPNGNVLAVVNLPDNRIQLFDLTSGTPTPSGAMVVGLDPVSVRFRSDQELWVVNHVSDSVSIVDVAGRRVVATLQTSDEPYDVVFAGTPRRAFVSCSQANQIVVFDPQTRARITTMDLPIEEPRSLAVSPDGNSVYVGVWRSSNATTLISGGDRRSLIPNVAGGNAAGPLTNLPVFTGGPYGGANPPPNVGGPTTNVPTVASFNPPINPDYLPGGLNPAPPVGLIVRKNAAGQWMDDNGGDWSQFVSGANANETLRVVGWDMPDRDIAVIDAATMAVTGYVQGLMNTVMAVGVNPATGLITAVGTEATNEIRFEPNLKSTFLRVRLSLIDPTSLSTPTVVDLNAAHLTYVTRSLPQSERDKSIGDPRGIVWNVAGTRGYISGMGSNNLIVVDATGQRVGRLELGEGPLGMALDDARQQLYVLNRFSASLSIVSLAVPESVTTTIPLFDPTPMAVKVGRRHLYDTHATSGLGQVSCASCHIDAREDALAWDLGDPGGAMQAVLGTDVGEPINTPNPGPNAHNLYAQGFLFGFEDWHPMKGPMTTQTLQDIIGLEPFHHRGDKDGIEGFAGSYVDLQGDDAPLAPSEMQEFEDFLATITYPPNPFRAFDNSLPTNLPLPGLTSTGRYTLPAGAPLPNGNAQNGFDLFTTSTQGFTRCVVCHTLPTGMTTHKRLSGGVFVDIPKGPNGESHLGLRANDTTIHRANKGQGWRDLYERRGTSYAALESKTGFGYMNDGREDTIVRRAMANIFTFGSDQAVADFVALTLSFSGFGVDVNPNPVGPVNPPGPRSHDTHAAVGKQVTITDANSVAAFGQADVIATMINFASQPTGRTDLIVKATLGGVPRGWFYDRPLQSFASDIDGELLSATALRAMATPSTPLTYTVVPRGSGLRIGIDRDQDAFGDRTEALNNGDPTNASAIGTTLGCRVEVNGYSFEATDALQMSLSVAPGIAPPPVDAYIVLETPSGQLLFMQPTGTLSTAIAPIVTNWTPTAFTAPAFNLTLSGSEPAGTYTWHTRLFIHGTATLAAGISSAQYEMNVE